MTNDRKIKANRANARVSTGPRTVEGRTRSARNALRHGLSLRVCSDPALCEEVEALAMDRYERRALFRRKTAIQVFDVARQSGCSEKGSNLRLQSAQNEAKFPNKIK